MGTSRWDEDDWKTHTAYTAAVPDSKLYTNTKGTAKALDPKFITLRESCDSDANPLSTPIMVHVDVTGSMGMLATEIIRKGLGTLVEEIYARKPVTDPHILLGAVGDAWCDSSPFQATQFEASTVIIKQLKEFHIEGGGGGNRFESYNLPWYFAAMKTKCDALLKRKKKGYLFTVGDEPPPPVLEKKHIKKIFNDDVQEDISSRDLLTMASQGWEVFHLMVAEGSYMRNTSGREETINKWRELLGERALLLTDHKAMSEVIVSTIQVLQGEDATKVAATWTGGTAVAVRTAVEGLTAVKGADTGVAFL